MVSKLTMTFLIQVPSLCIVMLNVQMDKQKLLKVSDAMIESVHEGTKDVGYHWFSSR